MADRKRAGLALDHASYHRASGTLVQSAQPLRNDRVLLRETAVVAYVVQPRRRVIALDPQLGIGKIAQQRPMPGAVAAADTPPFGHRSEKFHDVFLADDVFDGDHDGTGARLDAHG